MPALWQVSEMRTTLAFKLGLYAQGRDEQGADLATQRVSVSALGPASRKDLGAGEGLGLEQGGTNCFGLTKENRADISVAQDMALATCFHAIGGITPMQASIDPC